MRKICLAMIVLPLVLAAAAQQQPSAEKPTQQPPSGGAIVPEMSAEEAGGGACTVEFRITDLAGKPLYNAKVQTTIRYGFLNKRKLELEAASNADGRVRFVHLPNQVKNPLIFIVRNGDERARYTWDPGNDCHTTYTVPLKTGSEPK